MTKTYHPFLAGVFLSLTLFALVPLARGQTQPYAWGNNAFGQIGDSTTTQQRNLPVPVTATGVLASKTVVAMAAGEYHSLALCSDGTLAAWGWNIYGQLGNGGTASSLVPVAVTMSGMLTNKTVLAIAAGQLHSLALCSDGTVAAWGHNTAGQLGNGTTTSSLVPAAVTLSGALASKMAVAIAAGYSHSLVLFSDGTAAAWGGNPSGQLGNNSTTSSFVPVLVTGGVLATNRVAAIAAGHGHSLALCTNGIVVTWGKGGSGELGNNSLTGSLVPVAVRTLPGDVLTGKTVKAIAAGDAHSLALCTDGTLASWGANSYNQLGDTSTNPWHAVPIAVNTSTSVSALAGKTVVEIAAGAGHSLALCSDGTLAAWGRNSEGQLGDNTTTQRNAPVAVNTSALAPGALFSRAFGGSSAFHTLALATGPQPLPPQILVRGLSVTILDGDATPTGGDNTAFGDVAACGAASNTHTFTIHNFGSAPLIVTNITSSNPLEFVVGPLTLPLVIPAGPNGQDFTVTFVPNISGSRTATISLANNGSAGSPFTFAVAGNGTCGFLSGTSPANPAVISGPIYNPANGHVYYLLSQNTWTASETEALALGGHLATVRSPSENAWIYSQFGQFGNLNRGLWIGLNDAAQEGTFVWASGEPVSYLNWGSGEPANQDGLDDYVHLFWAGDPRQSQWNDIQNVDNFGGIPMNGVVEVTSLPPILSPTNKTVSCEGPWDFDPPTLVNACTGTPIPPVVLSTVTNGLCPQLITRTWLGVNACGNTNTYSQTVTVVDTTPPVFNCHTNKMVQCGVAWTFDAPTATDHCSPGNAAGPALLPITILNTVTNGTCPTVITRTWQAADACGNTNTCSQSVTILDTTPPVFNCPTNKIVQCGVAWTFDAPTATDHCSPGNAAGPALLPITILNTVTNGTCPTVITRTWQAADACGNTNTCSQTVTVAASTLPQPCGLTGLLSADGTTITYQFSGALTDPFGSLAAGTPFTGSFSYAVPQADLSPNQTPDRGDYHYNSISLTIGGQTVTDNGTGVINIYENQTTPYPTDLFHLYTFNVTGSLGGLTLAPGAGIQLVLQDTTGMAWSSPALPGPGLTMANLTTGVATHIQLQSTPSAFPGNTTIARGPLGCATPPLTLSPTLTCATNKTVQCGAAWSFDPPTVLDSCSGTNITVTILSTVTNGVCPMVITRTWQATDPCTNSVTCTQTVTVVDVTPPILTCATNKTVLCGTAWTFDAPTASDSCSGTNVTLAILSTVTNGVCPMVITRTWQATDACRNSVTCSQTVTVNPVAPCVGCETWTPQETNRVWTAVASSADGSRLVAVVYNGLIYTSANSGVTWTDNSASSGTRGWSSVASSSSGQYLVAAANPGQIYTSSNFGGSWTAQTVGNKTWRSVASDSSGQNLVAVADNDNIYTSSNQGLAWTARGIGIGLQNWHSVASDSSGQNLVAVGYGIPIYTSTDSGLTWTAQTGSGSRDWQSVASSADGSKLVAGVYLGSIYTSGNAGLTWTQTSSGVRSWDSIASSADGNKLVAVSFSSKIYCSTDAGASWAAHESNRQWSGVAASSDAGKLVAVVYGGGQIYTAACPPPFVPQCAANKTVQCGTVWNFDPPMALDACSGANATLTVLSTMTNGVCPQVITRRWLMADVCGNTTECSQSVTVVDAIAPIISSVPTGGNLGCNPANPPTDASVGLLVNATDNCGVPTINVSHLDLSSGCAVRRTFTITASDACLNTSAPRTVVYTWTTDTQPPKVECPAKPVTVALEGDCQIRIPLLKPKAKDNCTLQSQLVYTQNPPAGTLLPGPCQLVTVTVRDACGNATQCEINVCGKDKTPPKIDCPGSLTITNCFVPNVLPLKASDNCTPPNQLIFTQSPPAGTPIAAGVNQVTVTVQDSSGNVATCVISLINSGAQSFLGSMFNTGVNNSKLVMLGGAIDPHYTLGPVPLGTPTGLNLYNAPKAIVAPSWALPPFNLSAWITPAANSFPFPNGSYTYTNQFVLPAGGNAQTASISGKWTADNGAKMYFNGAPLPVSSIAPPFGYNQWTPFNITSGFLPAPAINRILFVVTNQNPYTGLRVEIKEAVINCSTCAPPAIVWMTPNLARPFYSTAVFTASVAGTPPMTFQWFRNGVPLSNNGHYFGVNTPTLTIAPPLSSTDAGTYKVLVSNSCGETSRGSKLKLTHGWPWGWGWWNFAQIGNPMAATVGPDLIMAGTNSLGISSGTTADFDLPNVGGQIGNVMHVPSLPGDTFIQLPLIGPTGSNSISSYTLIMDVFAPSNSINSASTLFESADSEKDGLRLLMEPSEPLGTNNTQGVTVTGTLGGVRVHLVSAIPMPPNAWSRVGLVVDSPDNSALEAAFDSNSVVSLYLNGEPVGSTTVATAPGLALDWGSLMNSPTLFRSRTENSGESYVAGIQFHAVAMTPEMIAGLGSAEHGPIPADDLAALDVDPPATCDPGKVIWVDKFNGIDMADVDGANQMMEWNVFNAFNGGADVALNPATGKIYWGDNSTLPGKVMEGNKDGTGLRLVTTTVTGQRVHHLAVDPGAGLVYWDDVDAGAIHRADISTGVRTSIPSLTTLLRGIALDLHPSSPNLYYYDGTTIYRADLNGANAAPLPNAIGDGHPGQFALDTCNDKIYVIGKTAPHPGVPIPYIRSANLSDGSGLVTILSGNALVGYQADNIDVDIALDLNTRTMYWTSQNNLAKGQIKSANMDTGNGLAILPVAGGAGFPGIALCLPDYGCPTTPTAFANKDFHNNTGQTVDGIEWLIQGTYSSVISHYDGPYPGQPNSTFSSFTIVPAGANTLLRWSGGASIPNGGFAHVGFTIPGTSLTTIGASWTIGGVYAGCVHQVSVGDGFSHVTGEVVFRNTATNCESRNLYVGNIKLEWFSAMVPLPELSINGVRRPLRADEISSAPVSLTPGGSASVKIPSPPLGARFAMIRYTVSASSTLAGPGNTIDYLEFQLQPSIEAPAITQQPQSQTGVIGGRVTLSVTATGTPPLNYQWRFNGINRADATNSTYTIANAQANDSGSYDVVVSNASGSVTSVPARLTMKNKFAVGQNADGTLSVAWPLDEGWILQEATNLLGPWSNSASQSSPVNLRPSGTNRFYRLVKP